MRLLVKHGADPLFVHHGDYTRRGRGGNGPTPDRGDDGADGGDGHGRRRTAWVPPDRSEREALTLEAVKLAVELGVDVNAANTDGRTALDAAKALKYETVVDVSRREGRETRESAEKVSKVQSRVQK